MRAVRETRVIEVAACSNADIDVSNPGDVRHRHHGIFARADASRHRDSSLRLIGEDEIRRAPDRELPAATVFPTARCAAKR